MLMSDTSRFVHIFSGAIQCFNTVVPQRYRQFWGSDKFGARDPIPAHLSGNMWSQQWQHTYDIVAPYPNASNPLNEVDDKLIEQV